MSKEKLKQKINTSNKGITLIALIITIVVMLILVAVTLDIAIGENGLVNKAKTAGEATTREIERETLLTAAIGAMGNDGTVNFTELDANLPEGFSGNNGTYTSKNGNTFTVSENGNITYVGENPGNNGGNNPIAFNWESVNLNVDTNTEYICEDGPTLNFTKDGKLTILSSGVIVVTVDATNSDNIDETTGNLSFNIKIAETPINAIITMANENDVNLTLGEETCICKKTIVDNETVYSNEDVLNALGITNNAGTYRGTWTVIGRENGKTKLVSTTPVTRYILGYEDPKAIEAVSIAGSEATEVEMMQRSIWSYKNAVTSLNTAAQEATGIEVARSIKIEDIYDIIGEENVNKGESYGTVYNYYYNADDSKVYSKYQTGTDTWSEPYNTGYSSQTFVDDEGRTVLVDSVGDEVTLTYSYYHCELTDDQKEEIGILASDDYWLAYPCVICYSNAVHFYVRYMDNGNISECGLFSSYGYTYNDFNNVRAVVEISNL